MNRYILAIGLILGLCASAVQAQQPAGPPRPPGGPPPADGGGPPPLGSSRPPFERAFMGGPPGRWWNNPDMVQKLGLTADQQKKMDEIFQESRLKLIDLNATLQKEEVILEPLIAADQPDEGKILAQIDRVAQGRAELEKANARMLLGIRRVLSAEQWKKLSAEMPPPPPRGDGPGPGRPGPMGRPGGPPPPPPAD
jgi:Spy/CpxP family protein refolding chaperone